MNWWEEESTQTISWQDWIAIQIADEQEHPDECIPSEPCECPPRERMVRGF